jgi:hypothetical protein
MQMVNQHLNKTISVRNLIPAIAPQCFSGSYIYRVLTTNSMIDSTKQRADNERALKKLIRKWLMAQETQGKAHALLSRNPGIGKQKRKGCLTKKLA